MEVKTKGSSLPTWAEIDTLSSVRKPTRLLRSSETIKRVGPDLRVVNRIKKQANSFNRFLPITMDLSKAFYLKTFCCKTIDFCLGQASNEAKVIQYDFEGKESQIWIIEEA